MERKEFKDFPKQETVHNSDDQKQVIQEIHIKAGKVVNLGGWLADHNFYP